MKSDWKKWKPRDVRKWSEAIALSIHQTEDVVRYAEITILLSKYSSKADQNFDELLVEYDELEKKIRDLRQHVDIDYIFDCTDKDEVSNHSLNRVSTPVIERAPGYGLLCLSGIVFGKKTKELVFEPWIADLQEEYLNAVQDGNEWQCRFIRVRGVLTAIHLALAVVCSSTLKRLIAFWKIT